MVALDPRHSPAFRLGPLWELVLVWSLVEYSLLIHREYPFPQILGPAETTDTHGRHVCGFSQLSRLQ
jgi:hypothetical protein